MNKVDRGFTSDSVSNIAMISRGHFESDSVNSFTICCEKSTSMPLQVCCKTPATNPSATPGGTPRWGRGMTWGRSRWRRGPAADPGSTRAKPRRAPRGSLFFPSPPRLAMPRAHLVPLTVPGVIFLVKITSVGSAAGVSSAAPAPAPAPSGSGHAPGRVTADGHADFSKSSRSMAFSTRVAFSMISCDGITGASTRASSSSWCVKGTSSSVWLSSTMTSSGSSRVSFNGTADAAPLGPYSPWPG